MPLQKVRLVRISLHGYRSCRNTTLFPSSNLTVLIGPNGSGKTNILNSLLLLAHGPTSRRPSEISDGLEQSCRLQVDYSVDGKIVTCRATLRYRTNDQNRDEIVKRSELWNFQNLDKSPAWIHPSMFFFSRRGNHFRMDFQKDLSSLSLGSFFFDDFPSVVEQSKPKWITPSRQARKAFIAIQRFRSNTRYYSASQFTNPSLCPTSIEIDEKAEDAGPPPVVSTAHAQFLRDLYRLRSTDKFAYERFISLIDPRGIGLVDKIRWDKTSLPSEVYEVRAGGKVSRRKRRRLLIIPTVTINSSQLSFNQLSEGTVRTLAILFYVVTEQSELLLLEEPEVCVHHGLLRSLIAVITEYSRSKQIILSTHSEAVVDHMQPDQIRLVSKDKSGETIVKKLSERLTRKRFSALKEYLSSEGNLGEFWRHGGF